LETLRFSQIETVFQGFVPIAEANDRINKAYALGISEFKKGIRK
jgi:hypothetical protein